MYCSSMVLIAFTRESSAKEEEWFVKCLFSRET